MLFFKRKIALVCGISMEPLLKNGDIVFYKNIFNKEKLSIGDIVILNHPIKNIQLIKRISSIDDHSIGVSGDNIEFSDDSTDFGLINKDEIIGLVTSRLSNKSVIKAKNFFKLRR
tara:strand:+ start:510 stop:854 length:345 start_codon:yes stop_codon:yes gene_type:complete